MCADTCDQHIENVSIHQGFTRGEEGAAGPVLKAVGIDEQDRVAATAQSEREVVHPEHICLEQQEGLQSDGLHHRND